MTSRMASWDQPPREPSRRPQGPLPAVRLSTASAPDHFPPQATEMQTNAKEAKQKRYDRQLRLWGEHGQEAMEECSVCLLNASACGSEALKNLVLPGVCCSGAPSGLRLTVRARPRASECIQWA